MRRTAVRSQCIRSPSKRVGQVLMGRVTSAQQERVITAASVVLFTAKYAISQSCKPLLTMCREALDELRFRFRLVSNRRAAFVLFVH